MYNITIISFSFHDIQNNQGLGKVSQPQRSASASADNYLDLDSSGYHKNLIQFLFKGLRRVFHFYTFLH